MCLFDDSSKNLGDGFCHALQSLRYQLLVLYDLSSFNGGNKHLKKRSWPGVVRIIFGYILYVVPLCSLLTLFMFGNSKFTLCHLPKATFLLDNDVAPHVNLSILYQARQSIAHELILNEPAKQHSPFEYQDNNILLTWDYQGRSTLPASYRRYQYWPLENIGDLIKQFNYVGFHDLCIYPRMYQDVTNAKRAWNEHDTSMLTSKGLERVAHGYAVRNSSGTGHNKFIIARNITKFILDLMDKSSSLFSRKCFVVY